MPFGKIRFLHLFYLCVCLSLASCSLLSPLPDSSADIIKKLISDSASCKVLKAVQDDMPYQQLYENQNNSCVLVNNRERESGDYFTDNQCVTPSVYYRKTPFTEFCDDINTPNSKDTLGNAASWENIQQGWTLYPGFRLNIGTLSTKNNIQPYMTRVKYRSIPVSRGSGSCELEMRIYKNNINEQGLKPLLATHGGGWKFRGLSFTGLENQISHFTNQGFVAFDPFYRLSGEKDGNEECNGASWDEPISDVEAALQWVKTNGTNYGSNDSQKINLLGGSAGSHLSLWLYTYFSQDIGKSIFLYPPADLASYISEFRATPEEDGEDILSLYLGQPFSTIYISSEKVVKNSFPPVIVNNPEAYPPAFIIHGVADTLVPSSQSVRLCNALAGDINNGPAINDGGDSNSTFRKKYQCGDQSTLSLIAEGKHGLDACIPFVSCPAGSYRSQQVIKETMREALQWIKSD
ncbi:MAG: acetyl esterase/lipase [Cocleimonas sp.]|jgi:acetyl esterase/lipase